MNALLMAVWRRKPSSMVTVHSDQGSQYTSHDWQAFLDANNLQASMSRRGNCHDNAVAESFFQLLKRERIKRHIYSTRDDAHGDVIDYIEMFYNSRRRHGVNNLLSPVEYEKRFTERHARTPISRHFMSDCWRQTRPRCAPWGQPCESWCTSVTAWLRTRHPIWHKLYRRNSTWPRSPNNAHNL